MPTTINKPVPPNLPLAPGQYSSQYSEQLNNVSRLYFNQLTNALGTLIVAVNGLETSVATLQAQVAALEVQGNNSQALIWLDM